MIANALSLLRGLLAFVLFVPSTSIRLVVMGVAALTDLLDGYLARRLNQQTPLGVLLDPAMDKLFVGCALCALFLEHRIGPWHIAALLMRDLSLFCFMMLLRLKGTWSTYRIRAFTLGKITTVLQMALLGALFANVVVPDVFFWAPAVTGLGAFLELTWRGSKRLI